MSENAKSHQFFIEIGGSLWSHFLSESLQIWLRQLLEIDLQPSGEQGSKLQGIMFQGDLQSAMKIKIYIYSSCINLTIQRHKEQGYT